MAKKPTGTAKWGYTKSGRKKKKPGRKKGSTSAKQYGPVYDPSKAGKKRRGRKPGSKNKTTQVGKERVMLEITCRKVA